MSKINTYTTVTPVAGDKVIGTDVGGTPADATKNFTVESIAALAGSSFTNVLSAESLAATQSPGAVNTLFNAEFGAAQGTAADPVMMTVAGGVTFNEVGSYIVEVCLSFSTTAAAAQGIWQMTKNGFGVETYLTYIDAASHLVCESRTVVRKVTAVGETLTVVFAGDNDGGLAGIAQLESYTPATPGFENVPSASINIYRLAY
jgi:hypothetical protein